MGWWPACPEACSSARRTLELQTLPWRSFLRYIQAMFEVLAYVYENYWSGDSCPEWDHLQRKLSLVGFDADEIEDALVWLSGLSVVAQGVQITVAEGTAVAAVSPGSTASSPDALAGHATQSDASMRIFSVAEQDHMGAECLGFVCFLEAAGVLPPPLREIVMDRAMASPGEPLALDDLKIIVLMVYWSFGQEPDALVLDELCDDSSDRVAH